MARSSKTKSSTTSKNITKSTKCDIPKIKLLQKQEFAKRRILQHLRKQREMMMKSSVHLPATSNVPFKQGTGGVNGLLLLFEATQYLANEEVQNEHKTKEETFKQTETKNADSHVLDETFSNADGSAEELSPAAN